MRETEPRSVPDGGGDGPGLRRDRMPGVTPAPPRRPRRWWSVSVQSAICVGLVGMVAWPERMLGADVAWNEAGTAYHDRAARIHRDVSQMVSPGSALYIGEHNRHETRRTVFIYHEGEVGSKRFACRCPRCPGMPGFWYYRDAGLHVLLGDLFE